MAISGDLSDRPVWYHTEFLSGDFPNLAGRTLSLYFHFLLAVSSAFKLAFLYTCAAFSFLVAILLLLFVQRNVYVFLFNFHGAVKSRLVVSFYLKINCHGGYHFGCEKFCDARATAAGYIYNQYDVNRQPTRRC